MIDHADQRLILFSMGRPHQPRPAPTRLTVLVVLLVAAGLIGLASAGHGEPQRPPAATGNVEQVQKGRGGATPVAHYPLMDMAKLLVGSDRSDEQISRKISDHFVPERPGQAVLVAALGLILLLLIWIDLKRAQDLEFKRRDG